jgi:H+/Cl- antiporter ClcA
LAATTDNNSQASILAAINEVSDKAQLLVREEIELAKAEVTEKLTKLARGLAVGAAAGVFVLAGLLMLLHGTAWLAWYVLPVGDNLNYFWGFFLIAGILFIVGGVAGFLAARWLKSVQSPTPEMAIEEAKLIRETVKSSDPETTI